MQTHLGGGRLWRFGALSSPVGSSARLPSDRYVLGLGRTRQGPPAFRPGRLGLEVRCITNRSKSFASVRVISSFALPRDGKMCQLSSCWLARPLWRQCFLSEVTTLHSGSLGSGVDEERSKLRVGM